MLTRSSTTRRGDIIVDGFASGTTIMAAEKVGRRTFAMEIEPKFVDLSIRRWQAYTGKDAVHTESGRTLDECVERARAAEIANEASSYVGGSDGRPL